MRDLTFKETVNILCEADRVYDVEAGWYWDVPTDCMTATLTYGENGLLYTLDIMETDKIALDGCNLVITKEDGPYVLALYKQRPYYPDEP